MDSTDGPSARAPTKEGRDGKENAQNTGGSAEQSTTATGQSTAPASDMDNMEKLREAHRLRKARRGANRPPPSPSNDADSSGSGKADEDAESSLDFATVQKLRTELTTARLEMSSMRRNHVTNVQKLKQERDMFALQLVQEQQQADPESVRGIEALRSEVKSVKLRNSNLEEENAQMRAELKELRLRLTAYGTLDAQQSGYQAVVNDLINVKLQCANLSVDNETLVYDNRVLKADKDALSAANGRLEKTRSDWVHKCADMETKLRALEVTAGGSSNPSNITPQKDSFQPLVNHSASQNSDLQELAL